MDYQGFIKFVSEDNYKKAEEMLEKAVWSTDRITAIEAVEYETGYRPLMHAVKKNNIEMVKLLHEKTKSDESLYDHVSRLDIHFPTVNDTNETPLIYAIKQQGDKYDDMIKLLLDLGTLTRWQGPEDKEFMVYASEFGKLDIVTEALKLKLEKLKAKRKEFENHSLEGKTKDMSEREKILYDAEYELVELNIRDIERHLEKSKKLLKNKGKWKILKSGWTVPKKNEGDHTDTATHDDESEGDESEGDESEGVVSEEVMAGIEPWRRKKGGQKTHKKRHTKRKHKRSKHKRSKHKRSKHKRSKHKRSKHKRSKHKRSKHKRINYTTRLRKNY